MFIKTRAIRKPDGQKYKALYHAYRDKKTGKPKHKYITSLSTLPDKAVLTLKTSLKTGSGEVEKADLSNLEILFWQNMAVLNYSKSYIKNTLANS